MSRRRSLLWAGVSFIFLVVISLALKLPLGIRCGEHSSEPMANPGGAPIAAAVAKATAPATNPAPKAKPVEFPPEGIPVLMYHSISTIPGNSLGVSVKQFSEEMKWLHRQNYHSLSLAGFYQALAKQAPLPDRPLLLTFDDGYSDNYNEAWPILSQNGFRATFFVITHSVGPGMMNWDQLAVLSREGNSVESHTVHHLDLSLLSSRQQENELVQSKRELEKHLGISVQSVCFPSGRYNKTTLELMQKLGYRLGFTTQPGRVQRGDDLLTLKRVRIYGGMPMAAFEKLFP